MRAVEPSHPDAPRSDVVIVGAGVIGLATAWRLRERGLSVSIVDPDPGGAASRAAAGMIAPASEVQYQQHALYPLMRKAASNYPDFVAGVQAASGHDVGYRRTETLVCAGPQRTGRAWPSSASTRTRTGWRSTRSRSVRRARWSRHCLPGWRGLSVRWATTRSTRAGWWRV